MMQTQRTVEGLDGVRSLLGRAKLNDAVSTRAALPTRGNINEGDGSGLGEDAAELINRRAPGDVSNVQPVRSISHCSCFVVFCCGA